MAGLTARQELFAAEYVKDWNATQAAIRAGYSPKSAHVDGSRLLKNAAISDAVARAKAEQLGRIGLTADRILEELAAIAFSRLGEHADYGPKFFELKDSATTDTRVVESVTVKEITIPTPDGEIVKYEQSIKMHNKLGALEKLMKHLGMVVDKKEISGPGGDAVQVEVRARDYREALGAFLPPADDASDS